MKIITGKMHHRSNRIWSLVLLLCSTSSCTAFVPNKCTQRTAKLFSTKSTTLPEGILKTISKPGQGKPVSLGDIATVKYTCYLPEDETAKPFAKSDKQKMVSVVCLFDAAFHTVLTTEGCFDFTRLLAMDLWSQDGKKRLEL